MARLAYPRFPLSAAGSTAADARLGRPNPLRKAGARTPFAPLRTRP